MTSKRWLRVGFFVAACFATSSTLSAANEESGGFTMQARASRVQSTDAPSTGGVFTVTADVVPRMTPSGAGLVLESPCVRGHESSTSGACGCLCSSAIFNDGFESGDTSAWSSQSLRHVEDEGQSEQQNPVE